jgi:hypothetical protein
MYILRIEHQVPDYDEWKKAFDSDPVGRERSGVRRYTVHRPIDEPECVMIDLEFDTEEQARALLMALRRVWSRIEGQVISDPKACITEVAEKKELASARAAA